MCDVFDQKEYVGIVNVSYMSAATLPPMKPFMQLAETIGVMQGQLSDSKITNVVIKTWGGRDVNITTKQAKQLLEAQVLKGLVRHQVPGVVPDLISAPGMAKEANIVSVISEEHPDNIGSPYWNLVSVEVTRKDQSVSVITGSVFGSTPHIVQVDDFKDCFAFKPEGNYILTFKNRDEPGAISSVLEILNNVKANVASVNVARMNQGNSKPMALCFMALDDNIPTNSLNALKSLSSLSNVAKIELRY
jgi:D-3-phosphoglycerate dehydrogenase / 2-oxoglutarate reductase